MIKVIFACAENKKRSQLAEAIFNHLSHNAYAISGGTFPSKSVDPMTIQVLHEIGINTGHIKPKSLKDEDLDDADLIISFGCLIATLFPKEKLQEWKIKDPQTIEEFRDTRDEITRRVRKLLSEIEK